MLEVEIKDLRAELALLREAVATLTVALTSQALPAVAPTVVEPVAKVEKRAPVSTPKVEQIKEAASEQSKAITLDELQSLCMGLVRADRTKREPIQKAIAKYGATNLVGVKDTDFGALLADLKGLQ